MLSPAQQLAGSAVAAPLNRLRAGARARVPSRPFAFSDRHAIVVVAALVVGSLLLRSTALHARYWIDEGLSVGIASHPLLDIPGLLNQDGSPPLYYLLLNVWMSLFGQGEAVTHVLSLIFALATVPAGFVFARLLYGMRAGLVTALLFALCPFLTYYAQETRMYSLVSLLSVCLAGSFALGFVERRRGWLPVFTLALTLIVYTHNWGLTVAAATVAAFAVVVRLAPPIERRALLRDGIAAYGVAGLLYLPWLPTFLHQAAHTAAPWSNRPGPSQIWNTLSTVLGGAAPAMLVALVGLIGVVEVFIRSRPTAASGREGRVTLALLVIAFVGIALPWLASQPAPAWATRYFASVLGPLLLIAGIGLARAGWVGILAAVLLVPFWSSPQTAKIENKSDAHHAATGVRDFLYPGDLVLAAHPEYGPALHLYLPPGLHWANTLGPVKDPSIMDWRDAMDRLEAAKPRRLENQMVGSLRDGQHLLLIIPIWKTANWKAPWTSLVRRRALRWQHLLNHDKRLVRIFSAPRDLSHRRLPRGVRLILYARVPDGAGGRAAPYVRDR